VRLADAADSAATVHRDRTRPAAGSGDRQARPRRPDVPSFHAVGAGRMHRAQPVRAYAVAATARDRVLLTRVAKVSGAGSCICRAAAPTLASPPWPGVLRELLKRLDSRANSRRSRGQSPRRGLARSEGYPIEWPGVPSVLSRPLSRRRRPNRRARCRELDGEARCYPDRDLVALDQAEDRPRSRRKRSPANGSPPRRRTKDRESAPRTAVRTMPGRPARASGPDESSGDHADRLEKHDGPAWPAREQWRAVAGGSLRRGIHGETNPCGPTRAGRCGRQDNSSREAPIPIESTRSEGERYHQMRGRTDHDQQNTQKPDEDKTV